MSNEKYDPTKIQTKETHPFRTARNKERHYPLVLLIHLFNMKSTIIKVDYYFIEKIYAKIYCALYDTHRIA